jgi:hypothetical protein
MFKFGNLACAVLTLVTAMQTSALAATVATSKEPEILLLHSGTQVRLTGLLTLNAKSLAAASTQYYLRVDGLAVDGDPETGFHLFLNIDPSLPEDTRNPGYVGTITFFDAPKVAKLASSKAISFDITAAVQRIHQLETPRELVVSIYPAATAAPNSKSYVRGISITSK